MKNKIKDISRYRYGARDEAACKAKSVKNLATNAEQGRKGGKYYDKYLTYMRTGIPREKCRVRGLHNRIYVKFKRIIDPHGLTQIHHEYLNDGTANFRGVALVEKDQHQHGIIKPIIILQGSITLMTEKDIREQRTLVKNEIKGGI